MFFLAGLAAASGSPALSALDASTKTLAVARPFSRELVIVSCDTLDVSARAALPFDAAALAVDGERGRVYVAGPESVRVYALADLKTTGELPLKGAVFLAALPGGELAALDKENVLTVARTEPYAVRRAARLDPGADVRGWNARLDPGCRYVPRAMRFDAANNRLHIVVGPPDGDMMYARNHKPVDAWLVVNPATGETEALVPVLAPCADIAFDPAAGRAYGVSRAYNADHILVLDTAGQSACGVIPLEPMEVHNVDRIALAPGGLLALASSWHPKELFFVRRDAPAEWWGDVSPRDTEFYAGSADEIERVLRTGDLGSEAQAGALRPEVVAATVSLWGLRGGYDALHFAPWDESLYLPGERGAIAIGRETIESLLPASRPTQAFYLREGETFRDMLNRLPETPIAQQPDHNTLGPERALHLAELQSEGDAFRVERYTLPGPRGIIPFDIDLDSNPHPIRKERPRVFVTPETLPAIRAKCEGPLRDRFEEYKREILSRTRSSLTGFRYHGKGGWYAGRYMAGAAFCYLMTGEEEFLAVTRKFFEYLIENPDRWSDPAGGQDEDHMTPVAAAYDWCHAGFTPEERERFGRFIFERLKTEAPRDFGCVHSVGWHGLWTHNGQIGWSMRGVAAAAALYGEPWLKEAETEAMIRSGAHGLIGVFSQHMETAYDGGNPEAIYNYSIRDLEIPMAMAALWQSITGQDVLERAGFLDNADAWILYGVRPDLRFTKAADGGPAYFFGTDDPGIIEQNPRYHSVNEGLFGQDKGRYFYGYNTINYEILAGLKQSPYFHWVSEHIGPARKNGHLFFIYFNPDAPRTPTHLDAEQEPQLAQGERLPLARLFRGTGYLFSKSGWDPDATHIYFCGRAWRTELHDTMENNSFQVFKGGPLLIDAGKRGGPAGGYADNYMWSTLSKNSLLVCDPNERLADDFHPGSQGAINVGGQINFYARGPSWPHYKTIRLCDRGGFQAYENHPEFMYSSANATAAYGYRKLRYFNRQIVHVRPDTVVVFDRVISKDPSFKKTVLFHSIFEPEARGNEFGVCAFRGLLRGVTLLPEPENAVLTRIGGPGREWWVGKEALYLDYPDLAGGLVPAGRNPNFAAVSPGVGGYYRPSAPPTEEQLRQWIVGDEAGAWRVEVSPAQPRAQDMFLHVLHAAIPPEPPTSAAEAFSPENAVLFPNSELVREDDLIGARISLPDGRLAEMMFETVRRPGGFIRITGADGVATLDRPLADGVDRTPRR